MKLSQSICAFAALAVTVAACQPIVIQLPAPQTAIIQPPPAAANAAPTAVSLPSPSPSSPAAPARHVSLTLGDPQPVLRAGELGLFAAPDMHMAILEQPDHSYHVFITGRLDGPAAHRAGTALLSTTDFKGFTPLAGSAAQARAVLAASCDGVTAACLDNFDADYAGANFVFPAANGKDLLMVYHGETRTFGATHNAQAPFYAEVGLARSTDNGLTWTRQGAIISGSEPRPSANPKTSANGAVEPGAIIANGFIYVFYADFPVSNSSASAPPTIQVARAPAGGDGAPGTWTKYRDGAFGSQPGLGGLGSAVLAGGSTCTRPAQPWPSYNTYLQTYVLVFVCEQGWFFSTSADLVNWAPPTQFYSAPARLFTQGQETDENVILFTLGNPSQAITGQTGYALYARTPAWGSTPHELWLRPFTFAASP